ncbi:MAG: leucine-rich repeat domain-containing protein [Oscillospiraceae bacterium]|nr:leucine-rich repeat domain-containing protein [Oscillospiraceae bacterium]
MDIVTENTYYELNNIRVDFIYDKSVDGMILCRGRGKAEVMHIPDRINGKAVKEIENGITEGISGMREIKVSDDNEYFRSCDGVLFDKKMTGLLWYPDKKRDAEYIVPKGVKYIGDEAFGNQYLNRIVISEGVESIYQYAFAGCRELREIVLPYSLRNVYLKAFANCKNLKRVYYRGTEQQWQNIFIAEFNDALLNAELILK